MPEGDQNSVGLGAGEADAESGHLGDDEPAVHLEGVDEVVYGIVVGTANKPRVQHDYALATRWRSSHREGGCAVHAAVVPRLKVPGVVCAIVVFVGARSAPIGLALEEKRVDKIVVGVFLS